MGQIPRSIERISSYSSNPQQIQPVEFEPNYAIQKHRLPCEDFQNKEKLT